MGLKKFIDEKEICSTNSCIHWLLLICALTGNQTHSLGMCPIWDQTHNLLVYERAFQQTEPPDKGSLLICNATLCDSVPLSVGFPLPGKAIPHLTAWWAQLRHWLQNEFSAVPALGTFTVVDVSLRCVVVNFFKIYIFILKY